MFYNYDTIRNRIEEIKEELKKLEMRKRQLPEGEMICAKNETRYKWYLRNHGKFQYISRKKTEFVEELALKKYYESKQKDLQSGMEACEAYARVALSKEANRAEKILPHPEYERLLAGKFVSGTKELEEWSKADYEQCRSHPENLMIKGTQGKILRSKSEALGTFRYDG